MKQYHKSQIKSIKKPLAPASFIALSFMAVFFLIFSIKEPLEAFFLFAAFSIGIILVFDQLRGLLILLIVRPLIDFSSENVLLQIGQFSLNFASALSLATIAAAAFVFLRQYRQAPAKKTLEFALQKQWLLFGAAAIASLAFSINISSSVSEILRIATILAFFCLSFFVAKQNEANLNKILAAVVFSSAIPLGVSFWQFFNKKGLTLSFEDVPNRVFGTFAHPNPFAYFISLALAVSLFFVFKKQNPQRIFAIGFALLAVLGIGLTFTRGAWLLAAGTIFLIGAIRFRKLLAISVLGIFLAYILIIPFRSRVDSLLAQGPSSSVAWRISIWSDSLGYALEKPVFGHGIGTAEELILEKRGAKFGSTIPHNDFIRVALDTGFVGLATYSYLLISAVFLLARQYKKAAAGDKKTALLTLSCFSFALLFASAIDNIFEASALQVAFWASVGALLATNEKT